MQMFNKQKARLTEFGYCWHSHTILHNSNFRCRAWSTCL